FNDSDNTIYIDLKSIPYTNGTGSYHGFSPDGTGSYQLPDWFNYVPLNIEITINDDEDRQLNSLYDSKFYYNITSTSNDLFDPTNVLSEGKYIDITATDQAYLSFDTSTISIENINGENFLNISGKIENYQSLIDAHGQLTVFERFNYTVEDVKNDTSSGYDFSFEFQKPLDTNTSSDLFDLSIPIPDYIPNGTINVSKINAALSFENYSWLNTEVVSTGSIDYDGRVGSDIVDPSINSLTYSQGARDYPSIIIDGNITDDVQLDYVIFEVKWPNNNNNDSYQSFVLPSSAIDENGNFSIEYAPDNYNWQYVNGDLSLYAAMAFDSSNNFTLYNDIDISGYLRGGNSEWIPVFYEEYERYETNEWYFRFNLDEATIGYGHLFDENQNGGSYANLSDEDVSFNGIVIPAKTIITPDGSVVQPSDEFFINNSYDAARVKVESSLGNDYINLSGSKQNISVEWSPGNDTYILDLNEEKHWQSPEFSANWTYNEHVEQLNISNPNGLIFNNNNGPALEVFSDYGKTLAFNIQEIETTSYDDTVIGRDNFEENIRLYEGNDTITSGYGGDTIRTKPHDTDSSSSFTITDYSSYDRIQIDEITNLNMNSYWDQFSISYDQGNTLIGINGIGGITNDSLFEIIGEKSLDYVTVEERVYERQYSPIHLEFYFDDDSSGNNLKRYTSDWFGGNTFTIDNDDNSIFITNYNPGTIIKLDDALSRFNFSQDQDFLNEVSVVKEGGYTKLSVNNGDAQFTNLIVIAGEYDLQGYGYGSNLEDYFLSFGSGEIEGTSGADFWLGNRVGNNVYNGLGGDDYIVGSLGDDTLNGGDGNDWVYAWIGNNILDGGDGVDTLRYAASKIPVDINVGDGTIKYISEGLDALPDKYDYYISNIDPTAITQFTNFEIITGSNNEYLGDVIDARTADRGYEIHADDGDDTVYGSEYSDTISDGYGDDTIYGMGGNDTFIIGSGGDTFDGGAGKDTVIVNYSRSLPDDWTKEDYILINLQEETGSSTYNPTSNLNDIFISIENYYQTGTNGANHMVIGSDANNILSTSLGDDILDGGAGNDRLYGNEGDDILKTGSGDDKLYGGTGNDILEATGSGHQYLDGGEGNDTFRIDLDQFTLSDGFISLTDLSSGFHGSKADPDHALNDVLANIENVDLSGSYDAEIIGNEEDNVLISGSGNDVIAGGLGNDIIDGGKGNDVYVQDGASDQWSVKFSQNWEWVNFTPETINYTVTVAAKSSGSGNAYYLNGIEAPELTFKEGNTYIFDISDSSVVNHPFAFSEGEDGSGSSYTTNVSNNGNTIEITIDETTPDLNYYCTAHSGMGSSAEVSLINFGNFVLSNGNEINILNDIEAIQFDDKTVDLYGQDGGRSTFINTDGQDDFAGTWWEDSLDLSNNGTVTSGVILDVNQGTVQDGYGNVDTFSSIEGFGGTSYDDTLLGSDTDDTIPQWYNALNLNHDNYENFQPGDGVDTIDGRGGYDEISYTNSPMSMTIDLSQSTITDGWGNVDTISSIEGVEGTQHDDTIIGTAGDNSLDGRFGNNSIDGGDGFDYVEYNGSGRTNVVADLSINTVTFAKSSDTTQTFTDTLSNIEGVIGSSNDDIIIGDDQNNILEGAKGNDIIRGGAGNDILVTGHGDDQLYGEEGDDTLITVGSGTQSYDGGDGTDTLIVDTSYLTSLNPDYPNRIDIDLISGIFGQQKNPELRDTITDIENVTYKGLFNARIHGDEQSNIIYGGSGNDRINGQGGDDYLYGGEGDDTIFLGGSGNAYLDGGEGIDTFGVGLKNMDWPKTDDLNNLVNYKYTVNLARELAGNDTLVNFENVDYFGEYDSEITGDKNDNVISSGSGDDILRGGAGNDTLNAGAGNDFLYGQGGDDTLILGGSGTTVFDGGEGNDTVYIGLHSSREATLIVDFINGIYKEPTEVDDPRYDTFSNVENFVISETDNDVIMTGDDNDNVLTTDGGNDIIDGGSGNDTIKSGAGDDILRGGEGNDTLKSGAGDDQVFGDEGDDLIIQNGSGNQTYDGGQGNDTLKYEMDNFDLPADFVVEVDLLSGWSGPENDPDHLLSDKLYNIENIVVNGDVNFIIQGDANNN
ncbi:hypothetical protein N9L98_02075, partial [bacterium]|nr:hypothetical protein [bacterium]